MNWLALQETLLAFNFEWKHKIWPQSPLAFVVVFLSVVCAVVHLLQHFLSKHFMCCSIIVLLARIRVLFVYLLCTPCFCGNRVCFMTSSWIIECLAQVFFTWCTLGFIFSTFSLILTWPQSLLLPRRQYICYSAQICILQCRFKGHFLILIACWLASRVTIRRIALHNLSHHSWHRGHTQMQDYFS